MNQAGSETNTRILIVDDDLDTRAELKEYLTKHGFVTGTAESGEAMRVRMQEAGYDLIIMDLTLPGEDGLALTQYIRRHSQMPVIMLTGRRETIDRIIGLEMGADDYVTKPFELRELLARIRSVLRRAKSPSEDAAEESSAVVKFEGWQLDLHARDLTSPDGRDIALTTAEFKLLEAFVGRPKRVLERDFLLDLVHGREWSAYDRSIDNLVARLRRKIESDPRRPKMIKSVRGAGYLFAAKLQRR